MNGRVDETEHDISLCRFESTPANKKYKEQKLNEIIIAICAMLNSSGGNVVLHNECNCEKGKSSQMSLVVRILEQSMISILGLNQTVSNINFKEDKEKIIISVRNSVSLITTNYNLYLPSQSQVVQVSPLAPMENVRDNIINRKGISESIQLYSHHKEFLEDKHCGIQDSKVAQLKNLKASHAKRTTLADRMTGKGNKFSCYVSAFANYNGGHIYYGIRDDGVVEGELIPNEQDKNEITKKVGKVVNKMIWPEKIGQPKRGIHWEIFFERVVDENFKPIPSTFVIVIHIAACVGGVFTEEPECYEMVEGKVEKMLFTTWKKAILHQHCSRRREEVTSLVPRVAWSSAKARKDFTNKDTKLIQLINDGNWHAMSKEETSLQRSDKINAVELLILSKLVTASYRCENFKEARNFLKRYYDILPQANDLFIFEMMGFYLKAALNRASGDFEKLPGLLTEALSLVERIEPGLVTAIVLIFAATVTDLINAEDPTNKLASPDILSRRALEHLRCLPDSSGVLADMQQKAHLTLATFYLGCNINGRRIKDKVDISDIDKAKIHIMAVHQYADEGPPLSGYREVQLNLVRSIYNYRRSQDSPDEKFSFLRNAFQQAKKAEFLARSYQFTEMVHWSKAHEALYTEELVRVKIQNSVKGKMK